MITNIVVSFDTASNEFDFTLVGDDNASSEWYIAIEGPNENVIKVIDLMTADLIGTSGSVSIANNLTQIAEGIYKFEILYYPDGDSNLAVTKEIEFTYDPTVAMDYSLSHDGRQITVADVTSYPSGITGFTRSSSLIYPAVSGVPGTPNLVFTGASVVVTMALGDGLVYENVIWSVNGTASYTLTVNVDVWSFTYNVTATGSGSLSILIELDPCNIIPCIDDAWTSIYNEACAKGGVYNLPDSRLSELVQLQMNLQLYNFWVDCGDIAQAQVYYNRLIEIVGSGCVISSAPRSVSTSPVYVYGIWTEIQQVDYEPNFTVPASNPLAWRVYNGMLQFKGGITMSAGSAAGTTMIAAAYWTAQGIDPTAFSYLPVLDLHTSSPTHEAKAAFDDSGNLIIYSNTSLITLGHDFTIAGQFPLET